MPVEENDRALHDAIAGRYLQKDIVGSSSLARRFKVVSALDSVLGEKAKIGTLVEIGCGTGATATYLRGSYERYIGVDYSERLIDQARILNRGNDRAQFIAGNIKSVDLPGHCADVIYASGALHHMTELDAVMVALKGIAGPGAMLVVVEPQNSNPIIGAMRWVRGKIDPAYSEEQIFFAPRFLEDLFAGHGLADVTVDFQGYFSTPFAEVIIRPQCISVPLARWAVSLDRLLAARLPASLRKTSFNIIVSGRFP